MHHKHLYLQATSAMYAQTAMHPSINKRQKALTARTYTSHLKGSYRQKQKQQRQAHSIKSLKSWKCDRFKSRVSFAWLPGAAEPEGRNDEEILSFGAFGVQETSLRLFSTHKHILLLVSVSEGKTNACTLEHTCRSGSTRGKKVPFLVVELAANCDSNILAETWRGRVMEMELYKESLIFKSCLVTVWTNLMLWIY